MRVLHIFLITILSLSACSSPVSSPMSIEAEQKIEQPIDRIIKDSEPSFDENEQNSGIIDFVSGKGWIITKNAAIRYNILIEKYGNQLVPAVNKDFGLSFDGQNFILTQEAMVKFGLLNLQHKSQIK